MVEPPFAGALLRGGVVLWWVAAENSSEPGRGPVGRFYLKEVTRLVASAREDQGENKRRRRNSSSLFRIELQPEDRWDSNPEHTIPK
jgi:hypothetical protein